VTNFRLLDNASEKLFDATLQKVQDRFEIRKKESQFGLKVLAKFDELKKYESLFVHKVTELKGQTGSFILLLIDKHSTIILKKRNGSYKQEIQEIEPILIVSLPHDVGKAFIRKETAVDKVVDLFVKVDIDFEAYPNFSKNYLVVGDNPELIKKSLPKGLLESLEKIKEMIVEINGTHCLIRSEKNLTEKLLLQLLSIGNKITN